MRYATPPLGNLRFRAPQDPMKEHSVINATQQGPICLGVEQPFVPPDLSSEDCLFINVYAPRDTNKTLPVMVWIQGGAFITNFNGNYNGTGLIEANDHEIIVATFNYRVGAYGFLASEEIRQDGDLNVGLLDQRKALAWIKENISKFNGDPERITIFGTSSGGGSVVLQTLIERNNFFGKQLFHAGIASASYFPRITSVAAADFQYRELLTSTNCTGLSCLRSLPVEVLQSANIARPFPSQPMAPLFPYAPVIDGTVLVDYPSALLSAGAFQRVPLLMGTSSNEGTIFAPEASNTTEISMFLSRQLPDLTKHQLDNINEYYKSSTEANISSNHALHFAQAAATYGDAMIVCPSYVAANAFASVKNSVYVFRNNILDEANNAAGLGVPHTWELEGVWGPGYATNHARLPDANSYSLGGRNYAMVNIMQRYWGSFARTGGDPNRFRAPGSPFWETWTSEKDSSRLRLETGNLAMEKWDKVEMASCRLWNNLDTETGH